MHNKSVYDSKFLRSAAAFLLLILMLLPATHSALAEENAEAGDLTGKSAITLPESLAGFSARLTDEKYNSRVSFSAEDSLEIEPASGAKGLYIAWYQAPASARIEALDAAGTLLETMNADPDLLNGYYPLPDGCKKVRVLGDQAFAVSELRVCSTAAAPESLCVMTAQQSQPKAMLILAHTGDESFDFGSLLPFFSGGDAALVFMSSESRQAQQQAIEARYALGSRTQPIFLNFQYYRNTLNLKQMYALFKKTDLSNALIQLIRRYQPETVITHSPNGERGDGMSLLTATQVLSAASLAADEGKEYTSARAYGAWQVSAIYQHSESGASPLYDTGAPIVAFGGKSAAELAQAAYDRYTSYRLYHASVADTPYFTQTYPTDAAVNEAESAKRLYALLASLSGPASLPEAAFTPQPEATPTPEAQPAEQPAAAVSETAQAPAASGRTVFLIGAGVAALGTALLVYSIVKGYRKVEERAKTLRTLGIVSGMLFVIAGALLTIRASRPVEPAEATPAPTASPTAPAATATPAPTPKEDPFAEHFRQEGDPAEVVVFDHENGVYEYHSDTLGIEIRRITRTSPPLAYYVAHIYERDENSYRSGFGSERQNGRDPVDACTMARRYRAVLGLTGDNLLHSEYNRGMMIRDGRVFRAQTQQSAMALTDDFSMRLYFAKDVTMLNEIDEGTRDTYAFGPPLIIDGVLCENVNSNRVGRINPRAGLGLVEPGHFVAIVVDGRLSRYSHGLVLSDFAQLFLDEGCTMAYNLDGGASASMVFMGEYINLRADNHYRSVPDQLLWGYSELVPGPDEPKTYSGLVPQDWTAN